MPCLKIYKNKKYFNKINREIKNYDIFDKIFGIIYIYHENVYIIRYDYPKEEKNEKENNNPHQYYHICYYVGGIFDQLGQDMWINKEEKAWILLIFMGGGDNNNNRKNAKYKEK